VSHLPIAPVLVPLVAGAILLLLPRVGAQRVFGVVAVLVQLGLALALLAEVRDGTALVYALGAWPAPFGIVLVADRLAAWLLATTALVALFALLDAVRGDDQTGPHFHSLYQWQLLGLNGAFLTGDLFNLFVFFEILLIASYALLLHGPRDPARTRAGLHFVAVNLLGSSLFLIAVGTLYGVLGTLNMADLAIKVAATPLESVGLVRAAGLLLFVVFALKAALVPLYLWLPAGYAQATAPVAALFAVMTKVGAYSILRVFVPIFGPGAGPLADLAGPWLLPLALGTLAVGSFGALAARGLRRQAAYLVVASVGSLLVAFGLGSSAGIGAGLYYLPHSTFATAALFLLADRIAKGRGALGDRLDPGPAVPGAVTLGALFFAVAVSVVGLPPLSGFLGKALTLKAALAHPSFPWVLGVVLLGGLCSLIALARTGSLLFYRPESAAGPAPGPASEPQGMVLLPVVGLLVLILGLTAFAGPISDLTLAMAGDLLGPAAQSGAVLGAEGQ
jgi:multicomponent K+:H+ antiporter subunit D